MDGVELELVCPCGFEHFERVIVQRLPQAPIVTDFVACVGCRSVYFAPVRRLDPEPRKPGDSMGAIASQGAQTGAELVGVGSGACGQRATCPSRSRGGRVRVSPLRPIVLPHLLAPLGAVVAPDFLARAL